MSVVGKVGVERPERSANQGRYVFICGTPRSGTTFLAGIFGQHPFLVMGVERFKFHYSGRTLWPDLFQKERFFDLRPEDTSHREAIALPNVDEMRRKFDRCMMVGDKYPNIVRHLGWISERFDGPVFLFVLRNPVHVARSWAVRAANKNDRWPEKNDFAAGIGYWRDTLTHVVNARRAGLNVVLADYDLLVNAEADMVEGYLGHVLAELNLPWSDEVLDALLARRRPGRDASLDDVEAGVMRETLSSAQWERFVGHFYDRGELPDWAQGGAT